MRWHSVRSRITHGWGGSVTDQLSDMDGAAHLVIRAARGAVAEIAPGELLVFDDVAAAWRSDTRRRHTGWSVGFGVDATLLSEIAIQAVSSAFAEVLVLGAAAVRWRWL